MSLEGDGEDSKIIDLFSLQDGTGGWTETIDTSSTNNLVGIGTNAPLQKLDVKGGIKADSLFIAGKIKVNTIDKANEADSVVVRLTDGTLAIRDVSSLPTNSGGWTLVSGVSDESHLTLDGTEKLVLKRNLQGDLQFSLKNSRPS